LSIYFRLFILLYDTLSTVVLCISNNELIDCFKIKKKNKIYISYRNIMLEQSIFWMKISTAGVPGTTPHSSGK